LIFAPLSVLALVGLIGIRTAVDDLQQAMFGSSPTVPDVAASPSEAPFRLPSASASPVKPTVSPVAGASPTLRRGDDWACIEYNKAYRALTSDINAIVVAVSDARRDPVAGRAAAATLRTRLDTYRAVLVQQAEAAVTLRLKETMREETALAQRLIDRIDAAGSDAFEISGVTTSADWRSLGANGNEACRTF
jgi:hypothetical protein